MSTRLIGCNLDRVHCQPGGMAKTHRKLKGRGYHSAEFRQAVAREADKFLKRGYRTTR